MIIRLVLWQSLWLLISSVRARPEATYVIISLSNKRDSVAFSRASVCLFDCFWALYPYLWLINPKRLGRELNQVSQDEPTCRHLLAIFLCPRIPNHAEPRPMREKSLPLMEALAIFPGSESPRNPQDTTQP